MQHTNTVFSTQTAQLIELLSDHHRAILANNVDRLVNKLFKSASYKINNDSLILQLPLMVHKYLWFKYLITQNRNTLAKSSNVNRSQKKIKEIENKIIAELKTLPPLLNSKMKFNQKNFTVSISIQHPILNQLNYKINYYCKQNKMSIYNAKFPFKTLCININSSFMPQSNYHQIVDNDGNIKNNTLYANVYVNELNNHTKCANLYIVARNIDNIFNDFKNSTEYKTLLMMNQL